MLNEIAGRPFQVLNGTFDMKHVDAKRDMLRSERRNGAGGPMIQVPLLSQNAILDKFGMGEDEYVANGMFAQIFVRPGRFVASPIALWYAMMSPLEEQGLPPQHDLVSTATATSSPHIGKIAPRGKEFCIA
jgi:hypothetical protein